MGVGVFVAGAPVASPAGSYPSLPLLVKDSLLFLFFFFFGICTLSLCTHQPEAGSLGFQA